MKKLAKMNVWECTIPVGKECSCGSQLEAVALANKTGFNVDSMNLALITTTNNEKPFCWYSMKNMKYTFFTVFINDPPFSSPPQSVKYLKDGQFISHGRDIYQILQNKTLGQTIRQVAIFDDTRKASIVYLTSDSGLADSTPEEQPDYYLVRILKIDNPNEPICISWMIKKERIFFMQPVFLDDFEEYAKIDKNNLNWEFLHEGDTFCHNERFYQVCKDENNEYYIAPTYSVQLKIAVLNS